MAAMVPRVLAVMVHAGVAVARTGGWLLPGLCLLTLRATLLRRRSAAIWSIADDASATQEESASFRCLRVDHHCAARAGWTGDRRPELRLVGRGLPERQLPGTAAGSNPPPIPVPQTYEEAEQLITKNPFYAQTVPVPVRCNSQPIDVTTR